MSWMYYLLEANLYLILFYALYYLVLRRETWHQYNRAYLLGSSALAFIIPVVQLGFLKRAPVVEITPQSAPAYNYVTTVTAAPIAQTEWNRDDILLAVYLVVVLCLLVSLAIKITRLIILSGKGTARDFGKWKIINTNMERGAFSFFNYLFLSADMAASDTVITHELVHIRQKHSWDIIYLEIFKIINWFNPVAYLLQRSMKELHEFIADEAVIGSKEQIDTYTDFLVANAYGAYEHKLTNNLFNQSLLKKRIMMLHQKRSGNSARLKYLLALPLMGGLLCASTLAFAKDYGWWDIAPKHIIPAKSNPNIIGHLIDPSFTNEQLEEITTQFYKQGYKMEFKRFTDTSNQDLFSVSLIALGSTSLKNSAASATFRVNDMKKSGYVVFAGADLDKQIIFVRSEKRNATSHENSTALPSTAVTDALTKGILKRTYRSNHGLVYSPGVKPEKVTPLVLINGERYTLPGKLKEGQSLYMTASDSVIEHSPGEVNAKKMWGNDARNGVIELFGKASVKVIQDTTSQMIHKQTDSAIGETNPKIKNDIQSQIDQQTQKASNKLPPPEGSFPGFRTLYTYLEKHIRYPAKYFEQKTVDNVIVEFTTGADHKVSGVKIKNNAMPLFADEVSRQLKAYPDTVNTAPGTYFFLIQFNLINEKHTRTWLPSDKYLNLTGKPDCAGNIEIVGFVKEE